jgi:FtsP/CotA-like multicopper oxidase with cupredoxin domain
MYHSHFDEMTQMAMGMQGLFISHPRNPKRRPERDFAIMLNEWRIDPGTTMNMPVPKNSIPMRSFGEHLPSPSAPHKKRVKKVHPSP